MTTDWVYTFDRQIKNIQTEALTIIKMENDGLSFQNSDKLTQLAQ
jgi:hypothetical protein